MSKTFLRITAALLASTMLVTGASAETVRWARSSDALTLDPHSQNQGVTHNFAHHIYETLVNREVDGSLSPRLATEWATKEGEPNVWVFTLREGVTFHNGNPFTAEDVVFSLDRARSEKSNMRQLHADVASVVAVDDLTVEVHMNGPSPLYPNNLTNTFIMDKEWSEENNVTEVQDYAAGEDNYAVRNTNGTGPYILAEREPDVRSRLTVFEGHWADAPAVTEIVFLPITENATRIAALLSGEVDFVQDVPVQDIERLQSTDGITVTTGAENRSIYFAYRMDDAPLRSSNVTDVNPFQNPLVREAIHLAVDRDAIQRVVMRGQSVPTGIVVPPFVNGWTEELDAYPATDVARARELMAEAGYPDGFTVTLDTPNNRYVNDEAISQALVNFLGQIGIQVTLASRPVAQHSPLITANETDFYMLGWGVPTFDSAYNFNDLIHSKEGSYGAYNGGLYSNPEVDAMIESLGTEVDLDVRNATIAAIWEIIQAERMVLPIHNQVLAYATRGNLEVAVHPENQPLLNTVTISD
ncbi:ABC transporter substrate-binding protein [Ketogulonicigenium vulgare]|uniref:Putative binding-protein-dependent transport protein (Periplasmic) n=1 Tax=Ketogulonicigenium vulgare (strain WSH-001) TaxID=759362 RepID=F9Y791_KETVW|nr:ABC transporter substrate-binding protein [Ketogulonicigenium vulgare]ADO42833.1 putative binding-protein-dependent transport protein (periplasmic) [Ketogulonicigenium vulgare Y25]AEM41019.1 putative binding-protein-dependent transport protein (Periplasmic) [Ketogulonicigenium vulgare WSH-001]ALJ81170.1 peptide ABC transporter substrate-binding protein [Ketogulonicigenium vulgare]ANW33915.1 peptide ABC transporter substrate-binding protein [Ketogulonicigenium vulgare]AOZ54746.1 putative bin